MALVARLVLILALAVAAVPAAAQGWFGNLFGAPPPRQGAPAYPGYGGGGYGGGYRGGGYGGYGGGYGYAPQRSDNDFYRPPPRHHAQKRKPLPAPAEEQAAEAPKEAPKPPKDASLFVDVFGDSLGQMLADGLDDALADRADVAVIHKAKGSTGLVASDFYDWPKTIDDLLAGREAAANDSGKDAPKEASKDAKAKPDDKAPKPDKPQKIDVAVMMIGSNDKQAIREGGKTLAFGTPDWTAAYTKRVIAIDEAFKAHGIPLIWVGVPITKDDNFADAMASLNDITRDAAAKTGATFVDTWEAFSDDDGDFSAYGPDINGQTVRLRSSDGIHFTRAGARKLAHFVETHVRRALDGKTPAPQLPTGEASTGKPTAAAKPDAGPIRNLVEVPEAKDGMLAALPPRRSDDAKPAPEPEDVKKGDKAKGDDAKDDRAKRDAPADTTLARGEAQAVPAGRADDARWPQQGAPEP